MSRKESLKKALGIPEYPWSSDEEENSSQPAVQDVHLLRRQASENRISVADWPGTSGMPGSSAVPPATPAAPAPTPVRRNPSRQDRDLFWSTLNRASSVFNRVNEPPVSYTMRTIAPSNASPYRERNRERQNTLARSPVTDIHRILQAMSSRRTSSGSSRNSFIPSVSSRVGRAQANPRRVNYRPGPLPALPSYARSASASSVLPSGHRSSGLWRSRLPRQLSTQEPSSLPAVPEVVNVPEHSDEASASTIYPSGRRSSSLSRSRLPRLLSSQEPSSVPVVPDVVNVTEHSDEESERPSTVPPPIFPPRHENNNSIEDNAEVLSHETSAEGVALVDETVDLDPPDEAEPNPNALLEMNTEATASATEGSTANTTEARGTKRTIDADDENLELFTVTDFNQSLLRLLECPVCLEWMEPPISQCRRGHLVCSRCRARLASCPVCRTTFSSVRNRAMEGVAEMLRYPCRHGCGREVRLRRRAPHEASCAARKYHCPAPACADKQPLSHQALPQHFQSEHKSILRCGQRNTFSLKVNMVQHANWVISAHYEFFHLRADVDIRTWGVIVYVAYIGPKCNAKNYSYEVSVDGQHHSRRMVYSRATHSDLESSSFNVSLQDCFHLTVDQALNFLRFKTRHSEPEKFFDFIVNISECDGVAVPREESDS